MPETNATAPAASVPLCVDLDGTLVRTDVLFESFASLLKQDPLRACLAPFWLLRGRAALKHELAARVSFEAATLPYDERLLAHLRAEKRRGRRLVLVTAADVRLARAVAAHLGIFDDVIASDGRANLKGAEKAEALVARFGEGGFAYAGNESADRAVWSRARDAVVVSAPPGLAAEVRLRHAGATEFLREGAGPATAIRRVLRPHQWVKNLIVFVPLVTSHQIGRPEVVRDAVLAATSVLGLSPLGAYHALMYGQPMYFDVTKARTELGWQPRFSNEEMFIQSYDWYLRHRADVLRGDGASHHRSAVKQGVLGLVRRLL